MKKSNHYVDNELFLAEMTKYRNSVIDAKAENRERPQVPNYIGTCLFKIATHLSRRPNFARYIFREDMISDGVENCLLYIDNFDPEKSNNPFAYFTQIIYYAFLRRIQKEKKQMYVKYKSMENEVINALIENTGESDEMVGSYLNNSMHDSYAEEFIRDFIQTFEDTKRKKVISRKKKVGITKFMEENDADTVASTD